MSSVPLTGDSQTDSDILAFIKARHNISDGSVITIVATEEMILPEMVEEGKEVHKSLGGSI